MFYRWSEALHGIGYFGGVHFGGQVCMYVHTGVYWYISIYAIILPLFLGILPSYLVIFLLDQYHFNQKLKVKSIMGIFS